MDKQKLIAIAKDQLKGGIGEDQVRELLTYRGVGAEDTDFILREALASGDAKPVSMPVKDVLNKADDVFGDIVREAPLRPEDAKKERVIVALSIFAFICLIVVGSVIYYLYF